MIVTSRDFLRILDQIKPEEEMKQRIFEQIQVKNAPRRSFSIGRFTALAAMCLILVTTIGYLQIQKNKMIEMTDDKIVQSSSTSIPETTEESNKLMADLAEFDQDQGVAGNRADTEEKSYDFYVESQLDSAKLNLFSWEDTTVMIDATILGYETRIDENNHAITYVKVQQHQLYTKQDLSITISEIQFSDLIDVQAPFLVGERYWIPLTSEYLWTKCPPIQKQSDGFYLFSAGSWTELYQLLQPFGTWSEQGDFKVDETTFLTHWDQWITSHEYVK